MAEDLLADLAVALESAELLVGIGDTGGFPLLDFLLLLLGDLAHCRRCA
jgi:hypothetical protein